MNKVDEIVDLILTYADPSAFSRAMIPAKPAVAARKPMPGFRMTGESPPPFVPDPRPHGPNDANHPWLKQIALKLHNKGAVPAASESVPEASTVIRKPATPAAPLGLGMPGRVTMAADGGEEAQVKKRTWIDNSRPDAGPCQYATGADAPMGQDEWMAHFEYARKTNPKFKAIFGEPEEAQPVEQYGLKSSLKNAAMIGGGLIGGAGAGDAAGAVASRAALEARQTMTPPRNQAQSLARIDQHSRTKDLGAIPGAAGGAALAAAAALARRKSGYTGYSSATYATPNAKAGLPVKINTDPALLKAIGVDRSIGPLYDVADHAAGRSPTVVAPAKSLAEQKAAMQLLSSENFKSAAGPSNRSVDTSESLLMADHAREAGVPGVAEMFKQRAVRGYSSDEIAELIMYQGGF